MGKSKIAIYVLGGGIVLGSLFGLTSCGSGNADNLRSDIQQVQGLLTNIKSAIYSIQGSITTEKADSLLQLCDDIDFNYDASDYDGTSAELIKGVNRDIKVVTDNLKERLLASRVRVTYDNGKLLDGVTRYPVYLEKGECLYIGVEAEKPVTVALYNMDSEQVVQNYTKRITVNDSIPIRFSAIYMVEVNPHGRQYCSVYLRFRANSIDRMTTSVKILETSENCRQGDFLAEKIQGIKMEKAFEEPRKLTLRGQLKAVFSGSAVALVPLQVPQGATDILYNLRVSTNEKEPKNEKDFYDGMVTSYKKVKLLGLPLYESSSGNGLLTTLLGLNVPVREEDAYINMYVFYDAGQARKFQNGTSAKQLSYNLDYSTIGTQSCNGRIPTRGQKTVYLAFENERVRYNNYVWLSAIFSVPNTEYVRSKYSIE